MGKNYKTFHLEKAIKNYFHDELDIHLYNEVPVRRLHSYQQYVCGVVDLGNIIEYENFESVEDLGIEIKVSKSDISAKTGHNHYLDDNFLAVPKELVEYADRYLERNGLSHVGIISVDGRKVDIVKKCIKLSEPRDYLDVSVCDTEYYRYCFGDD